MSKNWFFPVIHPWLLRKTDRRKVSEKLGEQCLLTEANHAYHCAKCITKLFSIGVYRFCPLQIFLLGVLDRSALGSSLLSVCEG